MMDLDLGIISEVEKRQKKKLLVDYLYSNLKNHNFWTYRYFFCELLSLLNVVGKCSRERERRQGEMKANAFLANKSVRFFRVPVVREEGRRVHGGAPMGTPPVQ